MAKATAKVRSKVQKQVVKAGQNMPRNVGGILNAKVVVTANKLKNG